MQQEYSFPEFANPTNYWPPATTGQRLGNYLLDIVAFYLAFFVMGITLGIGLELTGNSAWLETMEGTSPLVDQLLSMMLLATYYFIVEVITNGRTVGKLFTRTRAVMEDGSELTTKAVALRSLCRLIPFDAFTFLGGGSGWHDRFSKTMVVQVPR